MSEIIRIYRKVLEQGFMPICVGDRFDIRTLAQATIGAGASAIEITCRRPNALSEIHQVKRDFPQLIVLAGSVVDNGPLLRHAQRKQPRMPSIAQLLEAGVDGVVSAMPLTAETIRSLSRSHLVIPGVESLTEIAQVLESGAHFAKLFTADLMGECQRVRRMTCAATHGLPPLFVTGGITLSHITDYIKAGVGMLGSGWDVILGDRYSESMERPNQEELSAALRTFLSTFQQSRAAMAPMLFPSAELGDAEFLASLPHYVPEEWIMDPVRQ
jgi:2-dehydro-3-deoxyphosphogluconate aldolase / (4S)-4-hydroxy-2-oxoglutarate aldolase